MIRAVIFDLDNTLYPPAVPLWRIVDARIERYVQEHLGTDPRVVYLKRLKGAGR